MKSQKINYFKYFSLFFAIAVLVFVAGCSGTPPAVPIINSFLANPLTITVGDSSALSWSVTDATSVTIDNGVGSVALTGTTTVSPTTTTTYTLTATNSAGSVTGSVIVAVGAAFGSIDINSNPVGAKVYLDGVDTGQVTPIILTNKEVGVHSVKLDKFHYSIWEDTTVTVNANQTTYLNPPLTYAATQYVTLQPGAAGIDSGVSSVGPDTKWGNYPYSDVGNSATSVYRTYIKFGLGTVPATAVVLDADLMLYRYGGSGTDSFMVGLHQVTSAWDEGTITWNIQPTCSADAEITSNITATIAWKYWDIDSLVQAWLDGSITNYGVVLRDTDEASVNTIAWFWTSDYTSDTSKFPKLVISYYIP